jgi:glycosyltransferase involved in cell wall biosynthesis
MSSIKSKMLSVMVANYNNASFLENCLRSIVESTYENIQLIIIDDGSTDNSKAIIETFSADVSNNPNISLDIMLLENNIGSGRAKLKALDKVRGEFGCFVDSDDFVKKEAFTFCIDAHIRNENVSLVYTEAQKINAKGEDLGILGYAQDGTSILHDKTCFHLAVWKVSKYLELNDRFNGNLQIAYDIDLYMKLEEVGDTLFINQPLYCYRVHDNNISIGFDKLGASYTERIISRWEAQKRRGLEDTKMLGEELQAVFNKVADSAKTKKKNKWLRKVKHKITNWFTL